VGLWLPQLAKTENKGTDDEGGVA
jgi:hypothetical protein